MADRASRIKAFGLGLTVGVVIAAPLKRYIQVKTIDRDIKVMWVASGVVLERSRRNVYHETGVTGAMQDWEFERIRLIEENSGFAKKTTP